MKIFEIKNIDTPWGDYSDTLLAGSSYEENGMLHIERTGPFVPSIIISGISDIIVTDKFKSLIEKENFSGISFQKVIKKKIVELHWENWDKTLDEPKEYPETGEPEDYIELGIHSEKISNQIGDLWKMDLIAIGKTDRNSNASFPNQDIWLVKDTLLPYDFFMPDGVLWNCISEQAKNWLEINCDNFLRFVELKIK
jgi:hypothetical protein